MNTLFVHHAQVERPPIAENAAGARERLREKFPRTALRRMTHLGLLIGAALDGIAIRSEDAVVYASTFAETRALEDYLRSFPQPSPLLFQTSIQPSAVQQVLIARQQPVSRFWPVTGQQRLVEAALTSALLEDAPRIVIVGGEECGTWMAEHKMASESAFGLALLLDRDPAQAVGRITFDPGANSVTACPLLADFAAAVAERRPLHWTGGTGIWALAWS